MCVVCCDVFYVDIVDALCGHKKGNTNIPESRYEPVDLVVVLFVWMDIFIFDHVAQS